ncbi:MAG: DUF799 family lipoprotein [Phycisphaerales bacterium]|nr:DUF799 family lipoprotein [Phycisphaerales bacterium]
MKHTLCSLIATTIFLNLAACAPEPTDYGAFVAHMPASILVLPPVNETAEVGASDAFLSTITAPLAEYGYYVFPVALVDGMMKENGVPTPGDMRQVSVAKLGEVFGADAVLYITIRDWTTRYVLVNSTTSVTLDYQLVDIPTGVVLWQRSQTFAEGSGSGGGGIVGMVVSATVHAAVNTATDRERDLARAANYQAFWNRGHGLLKGLRHAKYEQDQARAAKAIEKAQQTSG